MDGGNGTNTPDGVKDIFVYDQNTLVGNDQIYGWDKNIDKIAICSQDKSWPILKIDAGNWDGDGIADDVKIWLGDGTITIYNVGNTFDTQEPTGSTGITLDAKNAANFILIDSFTANNPDGPDADNNPDPDPNLKICDIPTVPECPPEPVVFHFCLDQAG